MKFPTSQQVSRHESSFGAVHSEARKKGFTGTLALDSVDGNGVAVYLNGWLVYAKFNGPSETYGQTAVEAMKDRSGEIQRHASRSDPVEMFRTYMGYIGRDKGLVSVHSTDEVDVPERTVVSEDGSETKVPPGTRIGYAPNEKQARSFFSDEGISGYALSNDEIVFFDEGDETERETVEGNGGVVVRMGREESVAALECNHVDITQRSSDGGSRVSPSAGHFDVYSQASSGVEVGVEIEGWEVIESTDGGGGGFLSGILGR